MTMYRSDETCFVLDHFVEIRWAFLSNKSSLGYYLRSLLLLKILPPKKYRQIVRHLVRYKLLGEKVRFLTEDLLLELLFTKPLVQRRIILMEIEMQCQQFFKRQKTQLKKILLAW